MDLNVQAFRIAQQATAEISPATLAKREAARKGGVVGGQARAKAMTSEQRSIVARKANAARWRKVEATA